MSLSHNHLVSDPLADKKGLMTKLYNQYLAHPSENPLLWYLNFQRADWTQVLQDFYIWGVRYQGDIYPTNIRKSEVQIKNWFITTSQGMTGIFLPGSVPNKAFDFNDALKHEAVLWALRNGTVTLQDGTILEVRDFIILSKKDTKERDENVQGMIAREKADAAKALELSQAIRNGEEDIIFAKESEMSHENNKISNALQEEMLSSARKIQETMNFWQQFVSRRFRALQGEDSYSLSNESHLPEFIRWAGEIHENITAILLVNFQPFDRNMFIRIDRMYEYFLSGSQHFIEYMNIEEYTQAMMKTQQMFGEFHNIFKRRYSLLINE